MQRPRLTVTRLPAQRSEGSAVPFSCLLFSVTLRQARPLREFPGLSARSFDNVCKINNRRTVKEQKTSQSSDGERRCYRCDSKEHLAYAKTCPALKLKCGKCGIVGHFAKVCRNKKKMVKCILEGNPHIGVEHKEYSSESKEDTEDGNFILNITDTETKGKPMCDMEIGGIPITMYADSGSPFTIVNEEVRNKTFANKLGGRLLQPDVRPESYT
ncbi:hypothetical protein NDU88_004162 [Pleurodeles waltl]|uniref:CCHC-type domain-containing protein n=1 Tax=Pleurodeles waltl TaxID=8319 RepID=A0AAV7UFQ4_PLEWA|nr:hypothetical protein NDU88_004162 [Pleurodeles waltl]